MQRAALRVGLSSRGCPSQPLVPIPAVNSNTKNQLSKGKKQANCGRRSGVKARAMTAASHALLANTGVLFIGAYLAGAWPLLFSQSISSNSLWTEVARSISVGLLLGSGLGVILPEGFHTLSESGMEGRIPNWASGAAILAGFMVMLVVHEALSNAQNALGFKDHPSHDRDRELLLTGHRALNSDLQEQQDEEGLPTIPAVAQRPGMNGRLTLLALVVHSAADGLAVGAASLAGSTALDLSVGLAILLHKLPVAASLTALLRGSGWSIKHAHQGLLFFALAAPVAALLTAGLLGMVAGSAAESSSADNAKGAATVVAGLAVLFSGGSFLYAVGDVMQSRQSHSHAAHGSHSPMQMHAGLSDEDINTRGMRTSEGGKGAGNSLSGWTALAVLGAGAVLPVLIAALVPED